MSEADYLDRSDPKHPGYADSWLDWADRDRKARRENGDATRNPFLPATAPDETRCDSLLTLGTSRYRCILPAGHTDGHFHRTEAT